jgi:hypothetical protein
MQFQVPQFIDTEDKIVGPLTLKQFGFIAAGGILSAILYFSVQPWLWVIGSIIIFGAAIALAFVKIEGRPFINVLISAFNFYWRPQTYIWQPEKPVITRPVAHEMKMSMGAGGKSALEELLARSATKIVRTPSRAAQVFSPRPQVLPQSQAQPEPRVQAEPTPEPVAKVQPIAKPLAPQKLETHPQPSAIQAPVSVPTQARVSAIPQSALISRTTASIGSALHKSWENLQTGAPFAQKTSDKQFLDKKMAERYQIFQRVAGDRHAAKRIDYR